MVSESEKFEHELVEEYKKGMKRGNRPLTLDERRSRTQEINNLNSKIKVLEEKTILTEDERKELKEHLLRRSFVTGVLSGGSAWRRERRI